MFTVTDADATVRVPVHERFDFEADAQDFINSSPHVELTLFSEDHWVSTEEQKFEYGPYDTPAQAQDVMERKSLEFPDKDFHLLVEMVRMS